MPGLRRDEVARLAGVSVDYHTRLERGALGGVSDSVLDAIARALELDQAETDHLYDLACASVPSRRKPPVTGEQEIAQSPVRHMLDAMTGAVAMVTNTRVGLVAANALGFALYPDMYRGTLRPANHLRYIFLTRAPTSSTPTGSVPPTSTSPSCDATPAAYDVRRHYTRAEESWHPAIGLLELVFQVVELQDTPGHSLKVDTATPGSASDEGLRLLASWAATEDVVDRVRSAVPVT